MKACRSRQTNSLAVFMWVLCRGSVEETQWKDQNIQVSKILPLLVVVAITGIETHSRDWVIAIERQLD